MKRIIFFFKKLFGKLSFGELPKNVQAIRVAQDVLAQIEMGRYKPKSGAYVQDIRFKSTELDIPYAAEEYSSVRELDVKSNFDCIVSCETCAIGAALLSTTKFKNQLHFADLKHDDVITTDSNSQNLLLSVFTPYQLALIEAAFEGEYNFTGSTRLANRLNKQIAVSLISVDENQRCKEFNEKHKISKWTSNGYTTGSEPLMIAIMQNIIDNNGIFTP